MANYTPAAIEAEKRVASEKRDRSQIDQERVIAGAQEAIAAAHRSYAATLETLLTAISSQLSAAKDSEELKTSLDGIERNP